MASCFIDKIQALDLPLDKNIDPSDYDWFFISPENAPLASFFTWFASTITSTDIISDEELLKYESLVAEGKVLSTEQVCRLQPFLSELSQDKEFAIDDYSDTSTCDNISHLEKVLNTTRQRQNQLCLQKLEMNKRIEEREEQIVALEREVTQAQCKIMEFSRTLAESHEVLNKDINKSVKHFRMLSSKTLHSLWYCMQLKLDDYFIQEDKFIEALEAYVNHQFKQVSSDSQNSCDLNGCFMPTEADLALQLVGRAEQRRCQKNILELNRLSKILESVEVTRIKTAVKLAQRKMETTEAHKLMGLLHTSGFPECLNLFRQRESDIMQSRELLQQELDSQTAAVNRLACEAVGIYNSKALTVSCQLQLHKQEYLLAKYNGILERLVTQLSRHDLLSILLDLDRSVILRNLGVLKDISWSAHAYQENHHKALEVTNSRWNKWKEIEHSGILLPAFSCLPSVLFEPDNQKTDLLVSSSFTTSGMRKLECGDSIKEKCQEIVSKSDRLRMLLHLAHYSLHSNCWKLKINCDALQSALFSDTDSLSSLPSSWLRPDTVSRQISVDKSVWDLKQKMTEVLQDYEQIKSSFSGSVSKHKAFQWARKV